MWTCVHTKTWKVLEALVMIPQIEKQPEGPFSVDGWINKPARPWNTKEWTVTLLVCVSIAVSLTLVLVFTTWYFDVVRIIHEAPLYPNASFTFCSTCFTILSPFMYVYFFLDLRKSDFYTMWYSLAYFVFTPLPPILCIRRGNYYPIYKRAVFCEAANTLGRASNF